MFAEVGMRVLTQSVIDPAYRIYAHDPLHAAARLIASITNHDLRMQAIIALKPVAGLAGRPSTQSNSVMKSAFSKRN